MRYVRLIEIEWPTTLRELPSEIPFLFAAADTDISNELFESYGVTPVSYKIEIIQDASKVALGLLLPGLF